MVSPSPAVSTSMRTRPETVLTRGALVVLAGTSLATHLVSAEWAGFAVVGESAVALVGGALLRRRPVVPRAAASGAFTFIGVASTLALFGRGGVPLSHLSALLGAIELGLFALALNRLSQQGPRGPRLAGRAPIELPRASQSFRATLDGLADVVVVLEGDLTIRYVSPSMLPTFGYVPDNVVGAHLDQLSGVRNRPLLEALRRAATHRGEGVRVEWELVDADGRRRVVESSVAARLDDPQVQGYVLCTRDVTERAALERQLRKQAFHDPLTGLANRALLLDRAHRALARGGARPRAVGLIALDLDAFSQVNDGLGRPAGDYMLSVIAQRLSETIGPHHTASRTGGDEFAILVDELSDEGDLRAVAESLADCLGAPISFGDGDFVLTASIGMTMSLEDGATVESLLGEADAALFVAKNAGGNTIRRFIPSMQIEALERFDIELDLRRALERSEFELLYQPTFDVASGKIASLEALLRWRRPGHGLVGPEAFVSRAEESGLLVGIGRWALRSALEHLCGFGELAADDELAVAVNLSLGQLMDPELLDDVRVALSASGIAPHRLILEISETILSERSGDIVRRLQDLRSLGIRLAIDDFGTGYATLSFLQRLPIDILKIDRSFVQACGDERGRGLLEAIVRLGQTLSVTTVGEGAEEPRQLAVLCELGCDMVQGFLLGRPISAAEVAMLVRQPSDDEAHVSPFLGRWLQRHVVTETARASS